MKVLVRIKYSIGLVAQLVGAPPCHGGGRGFKSRQGRRKAAIVSTIAAFCFGTLAPTKELGESALWNHT